MWTIFECSDRGYSSILFYRIMGKKRRAEDSSDLSTGTKRFHLEEYDSDESLHLPEHFFGDSLHSVNSQMFMDDDTIREKHVKKSKKEKKKSRVSFMLDNDMLSDSDAIIEERIPEFHKLTSSQIDVKSDVQNDKDDVANGGISRKFTPLVETAKHVIYLIRKPTEVSLSDLEAVKLPKDELGKKKKKLHTSEGKFAIKLCDMKERMFYVPATTFMTTKDSKGVGPTGIISGYVSITKTQSALPGGPVYEEDDELPASLKIELPLSGIRKQPNLNMDDLKQRLKAFGVKTRPKKRKC